jgi:diaminopimelate decarboxylase
VLTNVSILKLIRKHGAGIEVVSLQEAHLAMKAIHFTRDIVHSSGVDLARSLCSKRLAINLDNLSALQIRREIQRQLVLGIRLNPHILAGGNYKIPQAIVLKFGISIYQLHRFANS